MAYVHFKVLGKKGNVTSIVTIKKVYGIGVDNEFVNSNSYVNVGKLEIPNIVDVRDYTILIDHEEKANLKIYAVKSLDSLLLEHNIDFLISIKKKESFQDSTIIQFSI